MNTTHTHTADCDVRAVTRHPAEGAWTTVTSVEFACPDAEPIADECTDPAHDVPPSETYHHQSTHGGPVKCRRCQQFTDDWRAHDRDAHPGQTDIGEDDVVSLDATATVEEHAANYLRVMGHMIRLDLTRGLDPVDRLFQAMDTLREIGQDGPSEGVATLTVDVMLARITGTRIASSLDRLAEEVHPS